ncbi:beta-glucoside-specific PTS transporter subunit IIABC [Salipaludibacillus sp. LMS25]|jgi:PTS system beta-glucosides-specific IIC component|uniref:beta-glucoside-specific PTS transporter subunit IIABC n=1 Tax=Salipaludibacillus sp. LMS25 TaxID=2924031 RepID=UPI0020D1E9B1|nr:beta-glucoside-specific PTS transporter subunit IIABC [Salipaludibacillus sp. LMS25]UTR16505.1 beta-glucoside-specific PTS transporter subunit IIABC [Salipaludibacillus sp. LMS25]
MMKYEKECRELIELVGGKKNIRNLVHCATRLRFSLKDSKKAEKNKIEKLPNVLSVVNSGGQYQIVIGSAVADYYGTIQVLLGANNNSEEQKGKWSINYIFEVISGAFSPLIPAMAGSGMIIALLTVLTEFNLLSYDSSTYAILSAASNAIFYFLPIFLGITLAKKLGGNMFVGGTIGAALLEPSFTGLIGESGMNFIGIPLEVVNYATTIFPIFIAMTIYVYVDRFLKRIIFRDIQLFAVPMLSLMILVPLTAIIFGPFGTHVSDSLASGVMFLVDNSNVLSGFIIGGGMTFMVMLGLHWGFTPITLENLTRLGGDPIEGMAVAAVFAQIGIALGFFIKAKKQSKMRALAGPTAITGLLAGVTEPIVYGIILRYKRLIPIVAISGGIGGAINGLTGVTMNAYVFHNVFSMPVYTPTFGYLMGISASLISGGLLAYYFGVKEDEMTDFHTNAPLTEVNERHEKENTLVHSPLTGQVIPLEDVEDDVFSSKIAGEGVAIIPKEGEVVAPFDGIVVMVFPSKHAIGLKSKHGNECLIHVGLDTVNLEGKYFESLVSAGDEVKQGDPIMTFDREKIIAEGYKITTPVIVTDPSSVEKIRYTNDTKQVTPDSILFSIDE